MAKKKKSPKAASAPLASKKIRKQKAVGKDGQPQAEENLDNLPDNVLLRIFIKTGYKGRLTAMQGARSQYCDLSKIWPVIKFLQKIFQGTRGC